MEDLLVLSGRAEVGSTRIQFHAEDDSGFDWEVKSDKPLYHQLRSMRQAGDEKYVINYIRETFSYDIHRKKGKIVSLRLKEIQFFGTPIVQWEKL